MADASSGIDVERLDLRAQAGGTRIRLRVKPGARADGLGGEYGGALKISVTAAPEKGRANKAVARVLGRALGISGSSIELLSGQTSQDKTVRVPLSPDEVARRLAAAPRGDL